jgi:hypothetical protein
MPKCRKPPKGVEILVDGRESCATFEAACALAVRRGLADGNAHDVDVNFYSERAARAWGGDDAAESYREDPDASSGERIVIRVEYVGRVA